MDLQLAGKRALVTGSTLGIGRAIAAALAAEGASVIVNGRDPGRVAEAVREIAGPGAVSGCAADLSTAAGAATLAAFAVQDGPVDILVNNAGMFTVKEFFDIEDADWQAMFDLNVMSAVRLSRALMPAMLERGWGRLVFIGSDQSSKPNPSMAHYAMTKTALVSIARSLAERTRETGVTVNTLQVARGDRRRRRLPVLAAGFGDQRFGAARRRWHGARVVLSGTGSSSMPDFF